MPFVALLHALALLTAHQSGAADLPAYYSVGYDDCIAVEQPQPIRIGAPRLVLAAAQAPLRVTVDAMVPSTTPSLERRPHGDCTGAYRSVLEGPPGSRADVTHYAHISPLPGDHSGYEVFFAVPSSGAIVLGGAPTTLGVQDRRRLVDTVRSALPRSWRPDRTLVCAFRYGPANGHTIDELYAGLPIRNPAGSSPPIKRISIHRLFLIDGRLAARQEYERASGTEERVDTEAPELTDENWCRSDTEQTVAFVSRDDGRSWERLSTNVGFEGIHWIVQGLRGELPELFHRWLYTHH